MRPRVPTPPGPESHGFVVGGGCCWPEVLRWRLCAEREERVLEARGRVVAWEGELVRVLFGFVEVEERGRSTDARGVEAASE